jgi:hypothetical protein
MVAVSSSSARELNLQEVSASVRFGTTSARVPKPVLSPVRSLSSMAVAAARESSTDEPGVKEANPLSGSDSTAFTATATATAAATDVTGASESILLESSVSAEWLQTRSDAFDSIATDYYRELDAARAGYGTGPGWVEYVYAGEYGNSSELLFSEAAFRQHFITRQHTGLTQLGRLYDRSDAAALLVEHPELLDIALDRNRALNDGLAPADRALAPPAVLARIDAQLTDSDLAALMSRYGGPIPIAISSIARAQVNLFGQHRFEQMQRLSHALSALRTDFSRQLVAAERVIDVFQNGSSGSAPNSASYGASNDVSTRASSSPGWITQMVMRTFGDNEAISAPTPTAVRVFSADAFSQWYCTEPGLENRLFARLYGSCNTVETPGDEFNPGARSTTFQNAQWSLAEGDLRNNRFALLNINNVPDLHTNRAVYFSESSGWVTSIANIDEGVEWLRIALETVVIGVLSAVTAGAASEVLGLWLGAEGTAAGAAAGASSVALAGSEVAGIELAGIELTGLADGVATAEAVGTTETIGSALDINGAAAEAGAATIHVGSGTIEITTLPTLSPIDAATQALSRGAINAALSDDFSLRVLLLNTLAAALGAELSQVFTGLANLAGLGDGAHLVGTALSQGTVSALRGADITDGAVSGLAASLAGVAATSMQAEIARALEVGSINGAEANVARVFSSVIASAIRAAGTPGDPNQAFARNLIDSVVGARVAALLQPIPDLPAPPPAASVVPPSTAQATISDASNGAALVEPSLTTRDLVNGNGQATGQTQITILNPDGTRAVTLTSADGDVISFNVAARYTDAEILELVEYHALRQRGETDPNADQGNLDVAGPGGGPRLDPRSPTNAAMRVFTVERLTALPTLEIQGAGSQKLADAMFVLELRRNADDGRLFSNRNSAAVDAALVTVAAERGVSLEKIQADYAAMVERALDIDRRTGKTGRLERPFVEGRSDEFRVPELSSVRNGLVQGINGPLQDNGRHMASMSQLRFGSLVGDSLGGLDPVFGALLSPTGGIPGAGNVEISDRLYLAGGGRDVVAIHGVAHDAAGYLRAYHNQGPGYNYVPAGIRLLADTNPLAGQISGIDFFKNLLRYGNPFYSPPLPASA